MMDYIAVVKRGSRKFAVDGLHILLQALLALSRFHQSALLHHAADFINAGIAHQRVTRPHVEIDGRAAARCDRPTGSTRAG